MPHRSSKLPMLIRCHESAVLSGMQSQNKQTKVRTASERDAKRQPKRSGVHEAGHLHQHLGVGWTSIRISGMAEHSPHGLPLAVHDLLRIMGISVSGVGHTVLATLALFRLPDSACIDS